MILKKTSSLLALLFFVGPAFGLTESQVVESTIQFHPVIQAVRQELRAAEAKVQSALGGFDPLVQFSQDNTENGYYVNKLQKAALKMQTPLWGFSFEGGFLQSDGEFPIYEGKNVTSEGGAQYFSMNLPLLRGGWTDAFRTRLSVARLGVSQGEAKLSETQNNLVASARLAYWNYSLEQKKLEIFESLLRIAKERAAALKAQAKRGNIPEFDVRDNLRLIYQRETQVALQRQRLFQVKQALALFLRETSGEPVSDIPSPSQEIPGLSRALTTNVDELLDMASRQRPEVYQLKLKIDEIKEKKRLAYNQIFPDLSLQYTRLSESSTRPDRGDFLGEDRIGFLFSVPVLQLSARGQFDQLDAELSATQLRLRFLLDNLRLEIRNLNESLANIFIAYENAREESKVAKEVESGERVRFKSGQSDLIKVNIRETDSAAAEARYYETKVELLRKNIELERAVGSQKYLNLSRN